MVAQQQRHIYLVQSDLLGRKLTTNLDIINLDYDFLQSCLTIHMYYIPSYVHPISNTDIRLLLHN